MRNNRPDPDADPAPEFKREYIERARDLSSRGAGMGDLAAAFGVSIWAIKLWRTVHAEFGQAIKLGREVADDRVEMALYEKAIGYSFDAVKPMVVSQGRGEPAVIEEYHYTEHVPPDTAAARYWLNNRRPELWKERVEQTNVNKDDVKQLTDEELTKIIRASGRGSGGDGSASNGAQKSDKLH